MVGFINYSSLFCLFLNVIQYVLCVTARDSNAVYYSTYYRLCFILTNSSECPVRGSVVVHLSWKVCSVKSKVMHFNWNAPVVGFSETPHLKIQDGSLDFDCPHWQSRFHHKFVLNRAAGLHM